MAVILLIDFVVIVSMIAAYRRGLENVLPVFCFFLIVIPFESRLVIPGVFDLSTERVAMLTLLALFIAGRGYARRVPVPLKSIIWVHVAWVLCSTAYSLSVTTSVKQLIAQVVEYYFLYYVLLKVVSKVETVHKIAYAMVLAMGVCCLFGLLEAYATWSILRIFPSNLWITYDGGRDPLYIEWGRGLRLRSTFPHPILFGDALAMSIPIGLYLLSVCKRQSKRVLLVLILVLMFWAVYKTSSRGPWIATGISCTLLFLLVAGRVRKYIMVMALLAALVLATRSGIRDTIINLYDSTMDASHPVGASYLFRQALSDAIVKAVGKDSTRMMLGYGLGTFRELGLPIYFMKITQRSYTCDNNWAAFLYETGYVGLLIMIVLLFRPLFSAFRNYLRMPRPERNLMGVLLISFGSFLFLLYSVAGYAWGQQGFMSWFLISLSTVYPAIVAQERNKTDHVLKATEADSVLTAAGPVWRGVEIG